MHPVPSSSPSTSSKPTSSSSSSIVTLHRMVMEAIRMARISVAQWQKGKKPIQCAKKLAHTHRHTRIHMKPQPVVKVARTALLALCYALVDRWRSLNPWHQFPVELQAQATEPQKRPHVKRPISRVKIFRHTHTHRLWGKQGQLSERKRSIVCREAKIWRVGNVRKFVGEKCQTTCRDKFFTPSSSLLP